MATGGTIGAAPAKPPPETYYLKEMGSLAALLDQGIITSDEFVAVQGRLPGH